MHFKLRRQDGQPFEFEGKLLSRVQTQRDTTELGERGYDLAIYALKSGGFAAEIEYVTTVPGEQSQTLIEEMDFLTDVEDFFFAFEPNELIDPSLRKTLTAADRNTLLHRLYSAYESQLSSLLQSVRESHAEFVNDVSRR